MGDLGNVIADEKGRAEFQIDDNLVKVNDIIGRSIVISNGSDDLGRGMTEMSKVVYFSTVFRANIRFTVFNFCQIPRSYFFHKCQISL